MKVDHAVLARFGDVILERPHPADTAHERVDDHLRKRGRDRGIESVAAFDENIHPDIGGTGLRADDKAFHRTFLYFSRIQERFSRKPKANSNTPQATIAPVSR